MEVFIEKCAGLDVHSETIVACVIKGTREDELYTETETFPTLTKDLFRLLKWLETHEVTHIAMESTGVYWKPVFNILEDFFDITLANAQRIKNVPGRKTDVSDAEWIAKLLRHGLIEKSFVPPVNIRELRDLTRLRKKWIGHLTSEKNRIQKVLESSNVKLSTVISDVFGVSGRRLLNRLIEQGYVDEDDVEKDIHGKLAPKKQRITDSLFGTINEHQIFLIRQSWQHIQYLETLISEIDERVDQLLQNYQEELQLLITIPGISKDTAAVIIAEIGVDMGQFPTSQHLASWAGVSPGNHESAGKRKSTRTVKGNPHIKSAMCEAAWAVSRSRNRWLANKYWSLAARRGKKKALVAISHRMLRVIYSMLLNKEAYKEPQII
ncbi:IS110 family transposase [Lysinibacillus endophyticus]|uniref:IS110 family transposase n=1 Tax=Ureibacillus endophyticus TaxID=1978490 RepID=UPI001E09128D|nr:IS110 family transposase [Lysinibacillus endophyticus]MCP1144580.1 IS110 family transposase [Lysinibacillus endophyticus]MCP1145301.1 IS110 family transposase [Lysinibacillus endophyticus]MCP1145508.1 IS110 family transposase [Lysinibacillus endophyticus]MCP1146630.1 IS110 family transposase [Lysinibacillus endophyticus]